MSREGHTRCKSDAGEVPFGRELVAGGVGEECGDRHTYESVNGVPEEIEIGNLVGEEFENEKRGGNGDYAPVLQQRQTAGKSDSMESAQKSEGRHRCVDVETGSKARGDDQGNDLGGGERHCNRGILKRQNDKAAKFKGRPKAA